MEMINSRDNRNKRVSVYSNHGVLFPITFFFFSETSEISVKIKMIRKIIDLKLRVYSFLVFFLLK